MTEKKTLLVGFDIGSSKIAMMAATSMEDVERLHALREEGKLDDKVLMTRTGREQLTKAFKGSVAPFAHIEPSAVGYLKDPADGETLVRLISDGLVAEGTSGRDVRLFAGDIRLNTYRGLEAIEPLAVLKDETKRGDLGPDSQLYEKVIRASADLVERALRLAVTHFTEAGEQIGDIRVFYGKPAGDSPHLQRFSHEVTERVVPNSLRVGEVAYPVTNKDTESESTLNVRFNNAPVDAVVVDMGASTTDFTRSRAGPIDPEEDERTLYLGGRKLIAKLTDALNERFRGQNFKPARIAPLFNKHSYVAPAPQEIRVPASELDLPGNDMVNIGREVYAATEGLAQMLIDSVRTLAAPRGAREAEFAAITLDGEETDAQDATHTILITGRCGAGLGQHGLAKALEAELNSGEDKGYHVQVLQGASHFSVAAQALIEHYRRKKIMDALNV